VTCCVRASPSLALVKYWGKIPGGVNIPATSSLAVTLGAFHSTTTVSEIDAVHDDTIEIDGRSQEIDGFRPVIDAIRDRAAAPRPVRIESANDFPTAAGLASSSSGLAALTLGLDAVFRTGLSGAELSAAARLGSGSAARAVFGGYTEWRAGSDWAAPVADASHWPDVRILIAVLRSERKPVSSRAGMESSRLTSPYYPAWIETSEKLFTDAKSALLARDLEKLGTAMRQSYLRMFSTMFTSEPPLFYWMPESLAVLRCCEAMRNAGIGVWETMDAGPQVKLLLAADDVPAVSRAVKDAVPGAELVESTVGGAPEVSVVEV